MLERLSKGPQRVRTLFLSDIHLGTRGCQAEKLLDFLRHYEAETIYLVGDIVDGWQLRSAWYWPQLHNDVVQKLLRQARKGVRVFYIPGNHDEFLRDYYGTHFGGIEVLEDAVHVRRRCRFPPRCRTRREQRKGTPELRSRQAHQRLSDANRRVLPHVLVQREAVGGEDDDGRA